MHIDRFNGEKYSDPTAYAAMKNIVRQQERINRKFKPLVYICSPYAGDIDGNVAKAIRYCRFAIDKGCIPIASHLLYPQILDDSDAEERKLGLFFGMVLLDVCREIWIFSDGDYSKGMQAEYNRAVKKEYKIRYFSEDLKEQHREARYG